ncbi:hypothetical protein TKV_c21510 [Thermoanaerobacter kivui]|uniref:Uncharacterized protein n=1 Tax=Thermoanaerobacter kivui TaxID=2325 RepID=A0A097ATZ3_THEKI|nr:hypothetical protein [Thermoanaerobacter kivui]AIS53283.1 hypothetical protein TKV_c21510 [Thermoanaerobacter kivui]
MTKKEAMAIADQVVVMNRWKIEHMGTPEEVYKKPANLFVADFLEISNALNCYVDGKSLIVDGKVFSLNFPFGEGDVKLVFHSNDPYLTLQPENKENLLRSFNSSNYYRIGIRTCKIVA